MWNRGILTASHEQVLVLNDDLHIPAGVEHGFFTRLEETLTSHKGTFKINGSFSHYVISKQEHIDVGFFDERLLGLGEEDGDFFWRYHEKFGREIPSVSLPSIDNIQSDIADTGYTKGIRTAAKFNRDYIQNVKYKEVLLGGYRGMFDKRVKKSFPTRPSTPTNPSTAAISTRYRHETQTADCNMRRCQRLSAIARSHHHPDLGLSHRVGIAPACRLDHLRSVL